MQSQITPPDISVHAKFEENRSKTTQESGNKALTDARQDGEIFRGYNITPRHFFVWWGIKMRRIIYKCSVEYTDTVLFSEYLNAIEASLYE